MKAGKLTALLLSLVMAAGAAGCSYNTVETTIDQESAPTSASAAVPETTAAASESVPAESGTGSYAEKPAGEVKDSEGGKLVIWTWHDSLAQHSRASRRYSYDRTTRRKGTKCKRVPLLSTRVFLLRSRPFAALAFDRTVWR